MQQLQKLAEELRQGQVAPVYLFYGAEVYLQEKAVQMIRNAACPAEFSAFDSEVVDGEEVPAEQVIARAQQYPLGGGRRVVVVKRAVYFAPSRRTKSSSREQEEEGRDENEGTSTAADWPLVAYLEQPVSTSCLIFMVYGDVDRRRKIFKLVQSKGVVLEFAPLKPAEAVTWLTMQAREWGKKISRPAAELLVSRVGTDLHTLHNELIKVATFAGKDEPELTVEHVEAVVVPHLEENVFQVVDALVTGNVGAGLKKLQDLLAQKHSAPAIIALLARQIRILLELEWGRNRGLSPAELAVRLNVHPFVVKKMMARKVRFNTDQLFQILKHLWQLDWDLKTGRQDFLAGLESIWLRYSILKSSKNGNQN